MNLDALSDEEIIELETLLEEQMADGIDNIQLYPWQKRFISEPPLGLFHPITAQTAAQGSTDANPCAGWVKTEG